MPRLSRVVYQVNLKSRKPFPKKAVLILGALVALLIIFVGLWYAVRMPYLRVDQIEINGTQLLPAPKIEQAVRDDLDGVFWLVIPRDNFFFISSRRIGDDILRKFPQISDIKADKKFPRKIVITAKERRLWGLYCLKAEPPLSQRRCFYIDTLGTAYEDIPYLEGWLLPVIYGIEASKLGEAAVSELMLKFFDDAKIILKTIGGNLVWLSVSTTTPEDVRLGLAEGWEAVVTLARPASEWMDVLRTVLDHDVGDRRPQLEYIDLRFGNKVFYKYR